MYFSIQSIYARTIANLKHSVISMIHPYWPHPHTSQIKTKCKPAKMNKYTSNSNASDKYMPCYIAAFKKKKKWREWMKIPLESLSYTHKAIGKLKLDWLNVIAFLFQLFVYIHFTYMNLPTYLYWCDWTNAILCIAKNSLAKKKGRLFFCTYIYIPSTYL